jgi:hypothetical protein
MLWWNRVRALSLLHASLSNKRASLWFFDFIMLFQYVILFFGAMGQRFISATIFLLKK